MYSFIVTANRRKQIFKLLSFKGMTETVTVDYSPWADDNGAVTSVTVSVESGQATVANESIASNVKSMTIACSQEGASMLKLTSGGAGNPVDIQYIYVYCKDPTAITDDYGLCL